MMDELEKKEKIISGPFRQCFLVSGKAITTRYKETIIIKSTATKTPSLISLTNLVSTKKIRKP